MYAKEYKERREEWSGERDIERGEESLHSVFGF
jgi:hypothetical protein